MILEIKQSLFVHTPLGAGRLLFIIDYGMDINTCWVIGLNNGEIKHFDSKDIRLQQNYTYETKSVIPETWQDK